MTQEKNNSGSGHVGRFVRACRRLPVDRTPVWFLRQAGRYTPEYMEVRKHHSLVDICRAPEFAAEVTITAAERLGVDAAIIFADLLLPLTPMGLDFEFIHGEGPIIHNPVRSLEQIKSLRTDRIEDLSYVARSIEKVVAHFAPRRGTVDELGIIGFIGAPFTLASYIIEGKGSRNYVEVKKLMYSDPSGWKLLMDKLVDVLGGYAEQQIAAGAEVIQIFDSWIGALNRRDYVTYALEPVKSLVKRLKAKGVPVIYFGVDTASLLSTVTDTDADVIGTDWRAPLDWSWDQIGYDRAIQGNLDPIALFAPEDELHSRVKDVLDAAAGRNGHIFNLGHGIVPGTPVENVINVARWVKELSAR